VFGFWKAFTIQIYRELNNGNNGRTKHWTSAHRDRKAWRKSFDSAIVIFGDGSTTAFYDHIMAPPDYQQGLVVRRVLGAKQKFYDADSVLRGNAKELIDGLCEAGLAKDDNMKYIPWVIGDQDGDRREIGPFTEIEVWKQ
jgi:hypothetical protein